MRFVGATILAFLVLCSPALAAERCVGEDVQIGDSFEQGRRVAGSTDVATAERAILCLVNDYRLDNGLAALVSDPRLDRAARGHSQDMVARDYFDHFSPEGTGPQTRANAQGYTEGVGENIATNVKITARIIFEQWRNSPGHNANMLRANYKALGVGMAVGVPKVEPGYGGTGTQVFGVGAAAPGGSTGLELFESDACQAARAPLAGLLKAYAAALARVRKSEAKVKADRAAVKKAKSEKSRAKAKRKLAKDKASLKKLRTASDAAKAALDKQQATAKTACARAR